SKYIEVGIAQAHLCHARVEQPEARRASLLAQGAAPRTAQFSRPEKSNPNFSRN
ncbi:hypothetical protein HAX54_012548, partial [Datura stramonium]|nr:hypothetical protein [Datura stramonium]